MKKYYLSIDGQQSGPYSLDELKTMQLTDQNLIWEEGMSSWVSVNQLVELKESVKLTPPPLPTNKFQELRILKITLTTAFVLFSLIFLYVYAVILGGFDNKYDIESIYKPTLGMLTDYQTTQFNLNKNFLYVNYDGDAIRYDILLPLSLMIAVLIPAIIGFIQYRFLILRETKRLGI
jgi:hypothetical protein